MALLQLIGRVLSYVWQMIAYRHGRRGTTGYIARTEPAFPEGAIVESLSTVSVPARRVGPELRRTSSLIVALILALSPYIDYGRLVDDVKAATDFAASYQDEAAAAGSGAVEAGRRVLAFVEDWLEGSLTGPDGV
ncbi:MAG: hypothetical protein HXY25_02325 [Alphaproteobacteria bacterium]|nr:hypothetical protein [Alphaproteobacteria bacterium]